MTPKSLDCPSCGAPVHALDRRICTCTHCGRTFALSFHPGDVDRRRPALVEKKPTWGTILWRRFKPHLGAGLLLLAGLAVAGAALLISQFYQYTEDSAFGDEAIFSALLLGAAGLILAASSRKKLAIGLLLAGGATLASKPFLYPMWSDFGPEKRLFSLTSETHLNFLLPGILLVVLALLLALTIRPGAKD